MVGSGLIVMASAKILAATPSPAPAPTSTIGDTTGLQTWLTKSIVPIILTVVALTMMILARKKKNREIIEISLGVIVALLWIGVAIVPGKAVEVGSWAAGMLFG